MPEAVRGGRGAILVPTATLRIDFARRAKRTTGLLSLNIHFANDAHIVGVLVANIRGEVRSTPPYSSDVIREPVLTDYPATARIARLIRA